MAEGNFVMTICEQLAAYTWRASWDKISAEARGKLRQHLLDSVGCALGALSSGVIGAIGAEEKDLSPSGPCSLIGGGQTTPERAAFYNGACVRYLDFMDTFLAPGEACHPSDNIAGILAAAELAGASGTSLLTALAIAYHVQCTMTASGVPIMRRGFDHTLTLAVSLACGMSRVLGLTEKQTAHAIALCAAAGLGVAAARSGEHVPQWKGLASADTAFRCIHNVRLAQKGVTGPLHVFEGPLGVEHVLGKSFAVDWNAEGYDGVLACSLKRYNAEFHAQSAIEAILEMRREHALDPAQVHGIQVDIFKAGYDMIGGGKYVNAASVTTKEDADHSLPYLMAVALIDGEVGPAQFEASRIQQQDVQTLLKSVMTWLSLAYTREYPQTLKCKVRVGMKDGSIFELEKADYLGFFRRPMPVEQVIDKFKRLSRPAATDSALQCVIESVARLEQRPVSDLLLALRELRPEHLPHPELAEARA